MFTNVCGLWPLLSSLQKGFGLKIVQALKINENFLIRDDSWYKKRKSYTNLTTLAELEINCNFQR